MFRVQIPINMESIEKRKNEWAQNRRRAIVKLRQIADIMNGEYLGGDIAFIGFSIYMGGFFFKRLQKLGIVVCLAGAGWNIVAPKLRCGIVKHVIGPETMRLLGEDDRLLSALVNEAEFYIQLCDFFGEAAAARAATLRALVAVLRKAFITGPIDAVGRHSLRVHAVAPVPEYAGERTGVYICIVPSSRSGELASNEWEELATEDLSMREFADRLQKDLDEANGIALEIAHDKQ